MAFVSKPLHQAADTELLVHKIDDAGERRRLKALRRVACQLRTISPIAVACTPRGRQQLPGGETRHRCRGSEAEHCADLLRRRNFSAEAFGDIHNTANQLRVARRAQLPIVVIAKADLDVASQFIRSLRR